VPLPLTGTGEYRCPHTGDRYELAETLLTRHPTTLRA